MSIGYWNLGESSFKKTNPNEFSSAVESARYCLSKETAVTDKTTEYVKKLIEKLEFDLRTIGDCNAKRHPQFRNSYEDLTANNLICELEDKYRLNAFTKYTILPVGIAAAMMFCKFNEFTHPAFQACYDSLPTSSDLKIPALAITAALVVVGLAALYFRSEKTCLKNAGQLPLLR